MIHRVRGGGARLGNLGKVLQQFGIMTSQTLEEEKHEMRTVDKEEGEEPGH
jgi:hypothetical protein